MQVENEPHDNMDLLGVHADNEPLDNINLHQYGMHI